MFEARGRSCRIVMYQNLSDFLLDRCLVRLENGDPPNQGLWWHQDFLDPPTISSSRRKGARVSWRSSFSTTWSTGARCLRRNQATSARTSLSSSAESTRMSLRLAESLLFKDITP